MTNEQRAVLAHVVIDPDQWYADAVRDLGQAPADAALAAKVARWQPTYEAALVAEGANYRTRAEREA